MFSCSAYGRSARGPCPRVIYMPDQWWFGWGNVSGNLRKKPRGVNRRFKRPCLKRARKSTHIHTHTHTLLYYVYPVHGCDNLRCPLVHRYTIYAQSTVVRVVLDIYIYICIILYTCEHLLRDVQKSAVRARTLLCKRPFACNPRGLDSCRRRCFAALCRLINRIVYYYTYVYIHTIHRANEIESVKERDGEKLYRLYIEGERII